jgi:hypothetical protein
MAIALVATLATIAAACGGSTNRNAGADVVVRILNGAQSARTVHVTGSEWIASRPNGFRFATDAVIDFATDTSRTSTTQRVGTKTFHYEFVRTATSRFASVVTYAAFAPDLRGYDWIEVPVARSDSAGLTGDYAAIDPNQALHSLTGATVHAAGSATVDGIATTRYRVVWDRAEYSKRFGIPSQLVTAKDLKGQVFVDHDGRLRRFLGARGSLAFRYDFGRYGLPADIVVPSGPRVYDASHDTWAAEPDYHHLGPWRLSRGTGPGITWSTWQASAGPAWSCYTIATTPAMGMSTSRVEFNAGSGNPPRQHDHLPVTCAPDPGPGLLSPPVEPLDSGSWTSGNTGNQSFVGLTLPGVASARLTFADGSTLDVPVDPATHMFGWTGAVQPTLETITVTLPGGDERTCSNGYRGAAAEGATRPAPCGF